MIPQDWRDYTWKVRPLVVLAFILVSPAMVLIIQLVVAIEGVDWPAWVQAVGSVVAIFVAIGIAKHQTKQVEQQRLIEIEAREVGRAERLHILFWEVEFAIRQLDEQLDGDPGIVPGVETVEFLERFLSRAIANFDDDLDSARMRALAECRYGLISLIHCCHHRRLNKQVGNFLIDVKDAHKILKRNLDKSAIWLKQRGIAPLSV